MSKSWSSDVRISMPKAVPDPDETQVPMFGFVFTSRGLFHHLTQADLEEIHTPTFAPPHDPTAPQVPEDSSVDR